MSARAVLLTTDTTHHRYFAGRLRRYFAFSGVLLETRSPRAPFPTAHPYERQRDAYERDELLKGAREDWGEWAPTVNVESANDADALAWLRDLRPELIVVFGTGRLGKPVIESASAACVNLHGGDPQQYRGLDSHLWAIHEGRFECLVTTLHWVDAQLDTGAIVEQLPVPIEKGCRLFQLRARNTEACAELTRRLVERFEQTGRVPARAQKQPGPYRSFMPAELKQGCVERFEAYAAGLADKFCQVAGA